MNNSIEITVNSAIDEIFDTINDAYNQTKTYGVGNHWITDKYNLFVETGTDWTFGKLDGIYYVAKLEEYNGDDCVDCEVDIQDSYGYGLDKDKLKIALTELISRNSYVIEDIK